MIFDEVYKKVRPVLESAFLEVTDKTRLSRAQSILDDAVSDYIGQVGGDVSNRNIYEFILLTLFTAYRKPKILDSSRLKSKQFGFVGCVDPLQAQFQVLYGKSWKEDGRTEHLMSNLLSIVRNVTLEEYIAKSLYNNDIQNVNDLLEPDEKEVSIGQSLKDFFIHEFNNITEDRIKTIKTRWQYLMEGAFGIDPYVGVYTGRSIALMCGIRNNHGVVIEPDSEFMEMKMVIDSRVNYRLCTDIDQSSTGRTFDLQMIARTSPSTEAEYARTKPIYFPYKILEIAKKCEYRRRTQMLNYTPRNKSSVGDLYKYKDVIASEIETDIAGYIYILFRQFFVGRSGELKELERQLKTGKLGKDKFDKKLRDFYEDQEDMEGNAEFKDVLRWKMDYFVDCVTTAVILAVYATQTKKKAGFSDIVTTAAFGFKICSSVKDVRLMNNSIMVDEYFKLRKGVGAGVVSSTVDDIEDIPPIRSDRFVLQDFKYTLDQSSVDAMPVFAYKALGVLREQQSPDAAQAGKSVADWKNILLGKNTKGELIRATSGGKVNIPDNRVHFLIAGSRSGKGVMGYNIFSTALASQLPLFYIDRKPDTATVMHELAPEMFCVNGGQYDADIDYKGAFRRESYKFNIPSYLEPFIGGELRYDFVYFRAILLVLSMLVYADNNGEGNAVSKAIKDACAGGVVIVIDEITNFLDSTAALFSTHEGSSMFKPARSASRREAELDSKKAKIASIKSKIATERGKRHPSEDMLAMLESSLESAQEASIDPMSYYAAAFWEGYKSVFQELTKFINAGGDVTKNKLHIFLIGQDFEGMKSAAPVSGGGSRQYFEESKGDELFLTNRGVIPWIHAFCSYPCDALVGYNMRYPDYLRQNSGFTRGYINAESRCFAYRSFDKMTYDNIMSITSTADTLKGDAESYLRGWTIVKPFLILNNAVELPECLQVLPADEASESMRKGKSPAPDGTTYKDSQYVGQCVHFMNRAGLAYGDLVRDNNDGAGHLNQAVGFEGYIKELLGTVPVEAMSASGRLATMYVRQVLGYNGSWLDYLCDFSPEWIVTCRGFDGGVFSVEKALESTFLSKHAIRNNLAKMCGGLGSLNRFFGDDVQESSDGSPVGVLSESDLYGEQDSQEPSGSGEAMGYGSPERSESAEPIGYGGHEEADFSNSDFLDGMWKEKVETPVVGDSMKDPKVIEMFRKMARGMAVVVVQMKQAEHSDHKFTEQETQTLLYYATDMILSYMEGE